jgi:hypothetical protein
VWTESGRSGDPPDYEIAVYPNIGNQPMEEEQIEVAIEEMEEQLSEG